MKSWDNTHITKQYMKLRDLVQEAREDMTWDSQVIFNLVFRYS